MMKAIRLGKGRKEEKKKWLSYAEVETRLGVCRQTIWRMRKRGELQAGGIGRRVVFWHEDVERVETRLRRGETILVSPICLPSTN